MGDTEVPPPSSGGHGPDQTDGESDDTLDFFREFIQVGHVTLTEYLNLTPEEQVAILKAKEEHFITIIQIALQLIHNPPAVENFLVTSIQDSEKRDKVITKLLRKRARA